MTTLFVDGNENFWRAFEFIDDTRMLPVAQKPAQAKSTAKAFARFTVAFVDFNVGLLKKVIPGFHDLSLRFRQFEEAIKGEAYERMAKALSIIEELRKGKSINIFMKSSLSLTSFPNG